jgi:hypothetical protein
MYDFCYHTANAEPRAFAEEHDAQQAQRPPGLRQLLNDVAAPPGEQGDYIAIDMDPDAPATKLGLVRPLQAFRPLRQ